MECHVVSTAVLPSFKRFKSESRVPCLMARRNLDKYLSVLWLKMDHVSTGKDTIKKTCWNIHCASSSLEEDSTALQSEDLSDEGDSPKPLSSSELRTLLLDSERSNLLKRLSDANQYNRLLKRQLQVKEDEFVNFKSELAGLQLETQFSGTMTEFQFDGNGERALVILAEDISKYNVSPGSRKINGRYIQSVLFSKLEAVQQKLGELTKDVDAVQSKEISISWYGMAESVEVMGSFDNWSLGEMLSQEYTGYQTKFTTTLMLRPGRYEIKFRVDGEWKLSPEYPTVGEGLTQNNVLVVQ